MLFIELRKASQMENSNQMVSVSFHTAGDIYKLDNSGLLGITFHNTSEGGPKQFSSTKHSHSP